MWNQETNIRGPQGVQGPQGVKGDTGAQGLTGPQGVKGDTGQGVIPGGTTGQLLSKKTNADYDMQWATPSVFVDAPADGVLYARKNNVWSAAVDKAYVDTGDAANATAISGKVAKAGDTMTGNLTISKSGPRLILDKTDATGANIFSTVGGGAVSRWQLNLGSAAAESGGNTGCDFALSRYSDAGVAIDAPLSILRSTGAVSLAGTIAAGTAGVTGTYYFGNSGTKYLLYDGTQYVLNGGTFNVNGSAVINGSVYSVSSSTTGIYQFGSTGTKSLNYDGTNFNLVGGANLIANAPVVSNPTTTTGTYLFGNSGTKSLNYDGTNFNLNGGALVVGGNMAATGHQCRTGTTGAYSSNFFNLYYSGGPVALWIDATSLGNITVTSDYRIKKNVLDLPGMWDVVKKLRPIKYTQAEFMPPSQADYIASQKAEGNEVYDEPMFKADDIERWGFIAHELQGTLIPTASTGVKDSPDHVQSPNAMCVIAALTKALQEAMSRIEALEAR